MYKYLPSKHRETVHKASSILIPEKVWKKFFMSDYNLYPEFREILFEFLSILL